MRKLLRKTRKPSTASLSILPAELEQRFRYLPERAEAQTSHQPFKHVVVVHRELKSLQHLRRLLCIALLKSSGDVRHRKWRLPRFAGPITMRDVIRFKQIVRAKDNLVTSIFMDSEGGDVRAAIEIGRHLQEIMADVVVNSPARCASACVIILGAAPKRKVDESTIGIHRLYTTSTSGTFAERQRDFEQIGSEVKALFRRSGVRESLWDDMLRVPPERVKWLTGDEIVDYGLTGSSVAANDHQDGELAQRIGISKTELLRRKAAAERDCPPVTSLSDPNLQNAVSCRRNVVWGKR